MTLFDVSGLGPPTDPAPGATAAPSPDFEAVAAEPTSTLDSAARTDGPSAAAAAADDTPRTPDVEVRVSARRKKTSEARWDGSRIVVSVPAHLDLESRQKTIDWLVERLLSRQRLQPADDAALLRRAIDL